MANFENIVAEVEKMTALELSELVKTLEEKFELLWIITQTPGTNIQNYKQRA